MPNVEKIFDISDIVYSLMGFLYQSFFIDFIFVFTFCPLHVKWIFAIHFTKITAPIVFSSLYMETAYQTLLLPAHLQDSLLVLHTLQ